MFTREDAYQSYDCVRKEFPDCANFEGCPWIETKTGWARSNQGYLLEVAPTKVKVSGPMYEQKWPVYQLKAEAFSIDPPETKIA